MWTVRWWIDVVNRIHAMLLLLHHTLHTSTQLYGYPPLATEGGIRESILYSPNKVYRQGDLPRFLFGGQDSLFKLLKKIKIGAPALSQIIVPCLERRVKQEKRKPKQTI